MAVLALCAVLTASALQLRPAGPHQARREVLLGAAAAAVPSWASAYDSVPTIEPNFDANEKARKEREAKMKKNQAEVKPFLKKIASTTSNDYPPLAPFYLQALADALRLPTYLRLGACAPVEPVFFRPT